MTESEIAFTQRDELLAVWSKWWDSHLMHKDSSDAADWPYMLCIHSPTGNLVYHIAAERIKMFSHLMFDDGRHEWDGSGQVERSKRIEMLGDDL